LPQTEYDALVSRLVARGQGNTMIGDQALQALMVDFVLTNAKSLDDVKRMKAALAGIKQRAISDVINAFPNASIETLIESARASGYDVQVLKN
jgi:hypothetical protein